MRSCARVSSRSSTVAPGFQVVAEAGTAAEALEQARRFQPDLVVMDVRLPDGSGIEACREIRSELPDTRVVMLTSYPDEDAVLAAIVAGASGYLLKQVRARDLVAALETVAAGGSLLDPAVTGKVLERMRRIATDDDELAALTKQERKILALVAEGKTNKEIAGRGVPVGQDRQELRQFDPCQAQPRATSPGGGVRGPHEGPRFGLRVTPRRESAAGMSRVLPPVRPSEIRSTMPRAQVATSSHGRKSPYGSADAGDDELLPEAQLALVEAAGKDPVVDRAGRRPQGLGVDRLTVRLGGDSPNGPDENSQTLRPANSPLQRSISCRAGSSHRPM